MRFVIGDIHGEFDKLTVLLGHVEAQKPTEVVFLGDYIDKGKKSKQVIEFLLNYRHKWKTRFLKGNHEFKLLKALVNDQDSKEFLKRYGFKATAESYLGEDLSVSEFEKIIDSGKLDFMPEEHLRFIQRTENFVSYPDFFIVHAGIKVTADNQFDITDEESLVFVRESFLNSKMLFEGRRIVFGHTAFPGPYYDGYKLGIDTGAVYSQIPGYGKLSAVNLDTFEVINHLGEKWVPGVNIA